MNTTTCLKTMLLAGLAIGAGSACGRANPHDEAGDVRRFGAICDNKADDTEALIRAGRSSDDVYIAESLVCRVSGPLAAGIRPQQRWYGGGKITTPDGFDFTVFPVVGKPDVRFEGLAAEAGAAGAAHDKANARFIEFISGSHRGHVTGGKISGFQQAVRIHNSVDVIVDNNDIVNAEGWGISVQAGADNARISNNRIVGTVHEHGIYVAGSRDNPVVSPVVRGNTVAGSRIDGIKLSYAEDAVVTGNDASNNGGQGIYATIGTNRADIRDNVAASNADAGIRVFDGTALSAGNRVRDNTVRDNDAAGIAVSSSGRGKVADTEISGNVVSNNGKAVDGRLSAGIAVAGPATTMHTSIYGNRVDEQDIGVNVVGGTMTRVADNVFSNCRTEVFDKVQESLR